MALGLEAPRCAVRLDDGEEGADRGDVEGLEGDGERAEEGEPPLEDVAGGEAGGGAEEPADGAVLDGVGVVGVFFFFGEDLHCCCCAGGLFWGGMYGVPEVSFDNTQSQGRVELEFISESR